MLRRSVVVLIVCAGALAIAACGIKGPLKLPPGASAPAPTGAPPGAVPAESPTVSPAPANTAPNDDEEHRQ